nr:max dimerization protein 4 isoform X1 [Pelodiscus sinensis]XP_025046287.1 max dimerization protein 4 isoform X1 [Pelodiscus sinensis]|eukprot:XP_025046286.1 max dimerization protein 4 isoform X1 [Pelodiscus sinensis]
MILVPTEPSLLRCWSLPCRCLPFCFPPESLGTCTFPYPCTLLVLPPSLTAPPPCPNFSAAFQSPHHLLLPLGGAREGEGEESPHSPRSGLRSSAKRASPCTTTPPAEWEGAGGEGLCTEHTGRAWTYPALQRSSQALRVSAGTLVAAPRSGSPAPTSAPPSLAAVAATCEWRVPGWQCTVEAVPQWEKRATWWGEGYVGQRCMLHWSLELWTLRATGSGPGCPCKAPRELLRSWMEAGSCCYAELSLGVFKSGTVPGKKGTYGHHISAAHLGLPHGTPVCCGTQFKKCCTITLYLQPQGTKNL